MIRTKIVCCAVFLGAACGNFATEEWGSEQSEDPDLRCRSVRVDSHGYCRATNGTFAPSHCCEPQEEEDENVEELPAFECTSQMQDSPVGNIAELGDFVVGSELVEEDDYEELSALNQRQLLVAAIHLSFLEVEEDIESLFSFDVTDDAEYLLHQVFVTESDFRGTWIQFFAGGVEVGAIFEEGTTNMVAEVRDGNANACRVEARD